jgi:hypothetical protein
MRSFSPSRDVYVCSGCDANVEMLADYVMMLLKQEMMSKTAKSRMEIVTYLTQQLDDFLKEQSQSFVERVLDAFENKPSIEETKPLTDHVKADEEFAPLYSDEEEDVMMKEEDRHRSPEKPIRAIRSHRGYREFQRRGERLPMRRGYYDYYREEEQQQNNKDDHQPKRYTRPLHYRRRWEEKDSDIQSRTVIRVEKLPLEHCHKRMLWNYFSKFGTIQDIYVDRHRKQAHVFFESEHAATNAVRSLDAVFHNRFIRVCRARHVESERIALMEREVEEEEPMVSKTLEMARPLPTTLKLDLRRQQKEDTLKHLLNLQKQKQVLVQRLIQEQKYLMDRLASDVNMTEQDRKELLHQAESLSQIILRHRLQMSQKNQPTDSIEVNQRCIIDVVR